MHNCLIEVDGLTENWDCGVPSDWEQIINQFESRIGTPFVISKLNRYVFGPNQNEADIATDSNPESINDFDKYSINGKIIVAKMPLKLFRQCLINHFDIRYKMNIIEWPRHIPDPSFI